MEVFTDNKSLVLRLIDEVLNKGNLAAADQLVDPNFALHLPGSSEPIRGVRRIKARRGRLPHWISGPLYAR